MPDVVRAVVLLGEVRVGVAGALGGLDVGEADAAVPERRPGDVAWWLLTSTPSTVAASEVAGGAAPAAVPSCRAIWEPAQSWPGWLGSGAYRVAAAPAVPGSGEEEGEDGEQDPGHAREERAGGGGSRI